MAVTAPPAQPQQILPTGSDFNQRTWATAEEIREAVLQDCHDRGVRFRVDLFENVEATYTALRKRQAIGGDGTTSTRQLARDLYPDVGEDLEAARRKRESVRRWLALLQRQGLIGKEGLRSASGKHLGLRVALLPVDAVTARSRGCSSAG
jgi:hypothetical protein